MTHPVTHPAIHQEIHPGTGQGIAPGTRQKIPTELALQVGDHARAESVQATIHGIFI